MDHIVGGHVFSFHRTTNDIRERNNELLWPCFLTSEVWNLTGTTLSQESRPFCSIISSPRKSIGPMRQEGRRVWGSWGASDYQNYQGDSGVQYWVDQNPLLDTGEQPKRYLKRTTEGWQSPDGRFGPSAINRFALLSAQETLGS